jgi:limonene-1,2-epoxide hydrolase
VSVESDNRALVERFWHTLYVDRDVEGAAAMFADDGFYTDVPVDDGGATGPAQIAYRLTIGFEPIERFDHDVHRMVAEGDVVMTEHTETWHFPTGEVVALPFVSVHQVRDGRLVLWKDYSNIDTLLSNAPSWWIERIMGMPWPPPDED